MKRTLMILSIVFSAGLSLSAQSCTKFCNGQNKCCKSMENQNKESIKNFTSVEACHLSSKEQAKRYQELKAGLFKKVAKVNSLSDGYELIFEEPIEFSNQLIEFVNFERVCCPTFTFSLNFKPHAGPIHLEIRGSKGIKDIIAFELKENGKLNAGS